MPGMWQCEQVDARRRTRLSCVVRRTAAFLVLVFAAFAGAENGHPRTLTKAREVRELRRSDAANGQPVQLERAQVTLYQPADRTLALVDESGSILATVDGSESLALQAGDLVTVDGVTGMGTTSAGIVHAKVRKVGRGALPEPPLVPFSTIFSGACDGQWVSIEGVVRSAHPANPNPAKVTSAGVEVIMVGTVQDQLEVSIPVHSPKDAAGLIDAWVRIRAVARNRYNNRGMLLGVHLYAPEAASVSVLEAAASDPFELPLIAIGSVPAAGDRISSHRVHVRGVVASLWGDQNITVADNQHGIFVTMEQPGQFKVGDLVDVAGFPSAGDSSVGLNSAVVRRIGTRPLPAPVRLTLAQALQGGHDADPVEIDGRLIAIYASGGRVATLLVGDGKNTFLAVVPPNVPTAPFENLRPGSYLRVRGVCAVHSDEQHASREIDVLLRSPADVEVLNTSSWRTLQRALSVAGVLLAAVLGVIVWNTMLRRRVRAQTRLIEAQLAEAHSLRAQAEGAHQEKSEALANLMAVQQDLLKAQEELRHQASHDVLTGLWNRAAVLECLHREIERGRRTLGPLGLLLIDLDHFKWVNDTHGHLAGDAVLKEVAERLTSFTRSYDVVGRYGGEEFLIVLPDCGEQDARQSAERIRAALASVPFRAGESEFFLSASIGATVALDWHDSDMALVNQADQALYEAKSSGRNCTVFHTAPVARA